MKRFICAMGLTLALIPSVSFGAEIASQLVANNSYAIPDLTPPPAVGAQVDFTITVGTGFSQTLGSVTIKMDNAPSFISLYDTSGFLVNGSQTASTSGYVTYGFSYALQVAETYRLKIFNYPATIYGTTGTTGYTVQCWDTYHGGYVTCPLTPMFEMDTEASASVPLFDDTTRFDSTIPSDATTTPTIATTTQTISATGYINPADFVSGMYAEVYINNLASSNSCGASLCPDDQYFGKWPIGADGWFTFSTTTSFDKIGKTAFSWYVRVEPAWWQVFSNPRVVTSRVALAIVGEKNNFDLRVDEVGLMQAQDEAQANASTTIAVACSVLYGNIGECLRGLLVPSPYLVKASAETLMDEVIHIFPIGYATDIISIMSTTSTSTLTLIDTEMPSALGIGGGQMLTLDLAHSLDSVLYATTSQFLTTRENDTRTFFEITNDYWRIVMILGALMYILMRIFGVALIPKIEDDGKNAYYANGKGEYYRGGRWGKIDY